MTGRWVTPKQLEYEKAKKVARQFFERSNFATVTMTAKGYIWVEDDALPADGDVVPAADAGHKAKPRGERGMNSGTSFRVKAFHNLVKQHKTHNEARKKAHCDPRTYYDRCKEVTGEDPIYPSLPE